jgi:alkylation response protein AidB-like acyl-CoA dehydrogenase
MERPSARGRAVVPNASAAAERRLTRSCGVVETASHHRCNMPEQLTPELLALAERARRFAADELLPRRGASTTNARPAIVAASRTAGFFGMTQPSEFGGSAASALELTIVRDELASTNPPFLDAVFGPGPGVLGAVGEPLRSSHLVPLLEGAKRAGFGFTEPDDAPAPTRARSDGDWLVIDGQKSYVTGGGEADFINTLVQFEGHGPALVVIDTNLPGVELVRRFSSLDGSHHAAFRFTGVRVPASHVIGKPGEGMPRAMRQIGDTRMLIAAHCVGLMRWTIDHVTSHLRAPDRSGKPRGDKEGIRLRYADLRIAAFAARSMLYRTARLADAGENVINEAIACKVFATEAVGNIVDMAIQLSGGTALTDDHPLSILYRQVRSLRLAEGGSDVLRLNLAKGKLDLDRGRL